MPFSDVGLNIYTSIEGDVFMLCSRIRKKLEYALIVLVQENHIDSIKIKDLVLIAHISTSTFL